MYNVQNVGMLTQCGELDLLKYRIVTNVTISDPVALPTTTGLLADAAALTPPTVGRYEGRGLLAAD